MMLLEVLVWNWFVFIFFLLYESMILGICWVWFMSDEFVYDFDRLFGIMVMIWIYDF